jgi:hypothetical protein
VILEDALRHGARILLIQGNAKGFFAGFGGFDSPDVDQIKGRFSGTMSQKPQAEENRKMAKQLLLMVGVMPENMGCNPMWN